MPIQYLGSWQPIENEVMNAMLDLAQVGVGDKYVDLGCGDGQFVKEAALRGASAEGIEIDPDLVAGASGIVDVKQGDVFDADVGKKTVVSFWFSDKVNTPLLMDKLYAEMKGGAKLVMIHSSRKAWRDGVFLPDDDGILRHTWQPSESIEVLSNKIHLYVR